MLTPNTIPATGMTLSFADDPGLSSAVSAEAAPPPRVEPPGDTFGQIVALYHSNEFLFSELQNVKLKLARARAYRDTAGSNPVLAGAYLLQLRARHSAVLTMLRANRIEARRLLGDPGPTLASAPARALPDRRDETPG
jgi:hypothetical protein